MQVAVAMQWGSNSLRAEGLPSSRCEPTRPSTLLMAAAVVCVHGSSSGLQLSVLCIVAFAPVNNAVFLADGSCLVYSSCADCNRAACTNKHHLLWSAAADISKESPPPTTVLWLCSN